MDSDSDPGGSKTCGSSGFGSESGSGTLPNTFYLRRIFFKIDFKNEVQVLFSLVVSLYILCNIVHVKRVELSYKGPIERVQVRDTTSHHLSEELKSLYHRERILETSTLSCNEEEEDITKPPKR